MKSLLRQSNYINKNEMFKSFLEGNEKAFSYFYVTLTNEIFAYGKSLGADDEIIKDCIQDLFLHVHSNKKSYVSAEHLKFSLLKSLKNKLYNIYNSKRTTNTTSIDNEVLNFTISTTILDTIINQEDRIEIKNKIDSILAKLTSRQKEAVYLRFIKELEYDEVADLLNLSPQGARKLIHRAMKRLREEEHLLLISFFSNYFF